MNTPTKLKCGQTPTKATCDRTPTPRTDEAWAAWQYAGSGISVHVGRELERELTAVTEQRDRLAEALRKIKNAGGTYTDAYDELDFIDGVTYEALQSLDQL